MVPEGHSGGSRRNGKDDKVLSEPDHCPGLGAATEGS